MAVRKMGLDESFKPAVVLHAVCQTIANDRDVVTIAKSKPIISRRHGFRDGQQKQRTKQDLHSGGSYRHNILRRVQTVAAALSLYKVTAEVTRRLVEFRLRAATESLEACGVRPISGALGSPCLLIRVIRVIRGSAFSIPLSSSPLSRFLLFLS